jgi:hypothetical protein
MPETKIQKSFRLFQVVLLLSFARASRIQKQVELTLFFKTHASDIDHVCDQEKFGGVLFIDSTRF